VEQLLRAPSPDTDLLDNCAQLLLNIHDQIVQISHP
jgi:hypothetical protein